MLHFQSFPDYFGQQEDPWNIGKIPWICVLKRKLYKTKTYELYGMVFYHQFASRNVFFSLLWIRENPLVSSFNQSMTLTEN